MYIHPDSIGHNYVKQFPEIFEKYKPIRFLLSGDRMSDFFESSSFLFGSQRTRSISMIFSSVQRLYGDKHKPFIEFLKDKKNSRYLELVGVESAKDLLNRLERLWKEYNNTYGMRKAIHKFYTKWLSDKEKKIITSKMALQANYKPTKRKNLNNSLKLRLDILIEWRNKQGHAAKQTSFSDGQRYFHYEVNRDGKNFKLLSRLTFKEFYELTRKAMACFWIKEYEEYLSEGGAKTIDKLVDEVTKQCEELNRKRKEQKATDAPEDSDC